jgi:hypothetical protein
VTDEVADWTGNWDRRPSTSITNLGCQRQYRQHHHDHHRRPDDRIQQRAAAHAAADRGDDRDHDRRLF